MSTAQRWLANRGTRKQVRKEGQIESMGKWERAKVELSFILLRHPNLEGSNSVDIFVGDCRRMVVDSRVGSIVDAKCTITCLPRLRTREYQESGSGISFIRFFLDFGLKHPFSDRRLIDGATACDSASRHWLLPW